MPTLQRKPAFGPVTRETQATVLFDPEGSGYDMESALRAGLSPDETGHWQSRDPVTGLLLKGRKHKTWDLLEEGERQAGYEIAREKDGRYYSQPIQQAPSQPAFTDNARRLIMPTLQRKRPIGPAFGPVSRETQSIVDSIGQQVAADAQQSPGALLAMGWPEMQYLNARGNDADARIDSLRTHREKITPGLRKKKNLAFLQKSFQPDSTQIGWMQRMAQQGDSLSQQLLGGRSDAFNAQQAANAPPAKPRIWTNAGDRTPEAQGLITQRAQDRQASRDIRQGGVFRVNVPNDGFTPQAMMHGPRAALGMAEIAGRNQRAAEMAGMQREAMGSRERIAAGGEAGLASRFSDDIGLRRAAQDSGRKLEKRKLKQLGKVGKREHKAELYSVLGNLGLGDATSQRNSAGLREMLMQDLQRKGDRIGLPPAVVGEEGTVDPMKGYDHLADPATNQFLGSVKDGLTVASPYVDYGQAILDMVKEGKTIHPELLLQLQKTIQARGNQAGFVRGNSVNLDGANMTAAIGIWGADALDHLPAYKAEKEVERKKRVHAYNEKYNAGMSVPYLPTM